MSSEESNKTLKQTPSQDSPSEIEWDIEEMKRALKSTNNLDEFLEVKNLIRKDVEFLMRNNLRAYRQVTDIAETRELQLNNGQ